MSDTLACVAEHVPELLELGSELAVRFDLQHSSVRKHMTGMTALEL